MKPRKTLSEVDIILEFRDLLVFKRENSYC